MSAARKPSTLEIESIERSLYADVADITQITSPDDSRSVRYSQYKRLLDVVFAMLFVMFVASWLFPLIGLAIKANSRGPVFFKQRRYGKDGVAFVCLKFRTMTYQPVATFAQATKDDLRVTRIGRILRSTSLDELPQFINVLKGHMSVVGPRPHPVDLDDKFCLLVPNFATRYSLRPGITGLAQMLGHRGETRNLRAMAHRIRLDLLYVQKASLTLDARILFGTVYVVLRGDPKAY